MNQQVRRNNNCARRPDVALIGHHPWLTSTSYVYIYHNK